MNYTQLKTAIEDYTQNYETTFIANLPVFVTQAEQRIYNSVQFPSLRKNVTGVLTAGNKYLSSPSDYLSTYSLAIYTAPASAPTATGTAGASTITVSSASGIVVGQYVTGTGIGTGAYVLAISTLTITLSVVNSGAVSGSITFQGEYLFLLNKDVNFIRQAYPTPTSTGTPQYYALFGPTTTSGGSPAITNELTFILGPTPDTNYNAELHYYYYPVSISDTVLNPSGTSWLGDNFDTVLLYASLVEAYTFMKGETDMMTLYNQKFVEALALAKRLGDGLERQDAYRTPQFRQAVN
jgi:hypothetical protein